MSCGNRTKQDILNDIYNLEEQVCDLTGQVEELATERDDIEDDLQDLRDELNNLSPEKPVKTMRVGDYINFGGSMQMWLKDRSGKFRLFTDGIETFYDESHLFFTTDLNDSRKRNLFDDLKGIK